MPNVSRLDIQIVIAVSPKEARAPETIADMMLCSSEVADSKEKNRRAAAAMAICPEPLICEMSAQRNSEKPPDAKAAVEANLTDEGLYSIAE